MNKMNKERELIVAWQYPSTREWIPIGRLSKKENLFCFVYTEGVKVYGLFGGYLFPLLNLSCP